MAPFTKGRLDRAEDLKAAYAISGEARPVAGTTRVKVAVRVEEVATRRTLWERNFENEAASDLPLSIQVAQQPDALAMADSSFGRWSGVGRPRT